MRFFQFLTPLRRQLQVNYISVWSSTCIWLTPSPASSAYVFYWCPQIEVPRRSVTVIFPTYVRVLKSIFLHFSFRKGKPSRKMRKMHKILELFWFISLRIRLHTLALKNQHYHLSSVAQWQWTDLKMFWIDSFSQVFVIWWISDWNRNPS